MPYTGLTVSSALFNAMAVLVNVIGGTAAPGMGGLFFIKLSLIISSS